MDRNCPLKPYCSKMILEHLFTQENSGTPYSGVSVFMVSNEYVHYLDNEAR